MAASLALTANCMGSRSQSKAQRCNRLRKYSKNTATFTRLPPDYCKVIIGQLSVARLIPLGPSGFPAPCQPVNPASFAWPAAPVQTEAGESWSTGDGCRQPCQYRQTR